MRQAVVVTVVSSGLALAACAHLPWKPAQPIRVLVLDMHAGKDSSGKPNLDAIASLVRTTGADLVLLQDLDRGTTRSGRVDQLNALGSAMRYSSAFAASPKNDDGGETGNAALARGFIGFSATVPLSRESAEMQPGVPLEPGVALIGLASLRTGQFAFVNAHLDPPADPSQAREFTHLKNVMIEQQTSGGALLVGGNFNATPDSQAFAPFKAAGFRDAWAECGSGDGFTYPSDNPARRIDYVFLTGALHCSAAAVVNSQISDHRPLLVTLKPSP